MDGGAGFAESGRSGAVCAADYLRDGCWGGDDGFEGKVK